MKLDKEPELTKEDLRTLQKSIKDPKFHEILGEYMLEVSDPKNREEYDKYLLQLKSDGELPKDMELIEPSPLFCLQSTLASETDKKFTQAIYINVCTHSSVEDAKPTAGQNGGQNWQVPYLLGKTRFDQDNVKEVQIVSVIDIVFGENIKLLCHLNKEFKKMVASISFEAVNKFLSSKKEKANQDYRVVSEFACKGEKPALLPVKSGKQDFSGSLASKNEKPKLYHEIMNLKENEKKKEEKCSKQVAKDFCGENEEDKENQNPEDENKNGVEYKLFYSYETDSNDFIDSKMKESKKPNAIKFWAKLPKLEKLSDLKCDLNGQDLVIEYQSIYYLAVKIPIPVDEKNYKAKFDKSRKELSIELTPLFKNSEKSSDLNDFYKD